VSGQEIKAVIRRSPWFEGLPDSALEKLSQAATVSAYPVNSFIYAQGKMTTEVYCVLSGRVRISVCSADGQEFAVVDMDQEAWLGEPALSGDEPRVLDARVVSEARILAIPRKVVLDIGEMHPVMYRNLFRYMMTRTRLLYELLGGILFYPLRARVAGRLLHLAREHGEEVDGGFLIDIKLSQNDFARLALGSRQRVNKIFRDWTERGLVETRDDHLFVKDYTGLEQEIELAE